MRIVVYHDRYGCDTGCCGHSISVEDPPDGFPARSGRDRWTFDHPWDESESRLEWARRWVEGVFGKEHCADLDWENVLDLERVSDD